MPAFLRRSSTKKGEDTKISAEERERMKQRTANIADPILSALNEEQPFQMSSNHQGATTVSPELHVRDMFGSVIEDPDRSNPTRHRSERPLDTIRGFEYAATGDKRLKEQIFRDRLPWEGRHNVSTYSPYGSAPIDDSHSQGVVYDEYGTPIPQPPATPSSRTPIQLGSTGAGDPTYDAPLPDPKDKKKKKRGLFGRKKD
ncbi:hypothetical protein BZA70DRAFT_266338 [Myxozyma melibiosi]|uniref:Uncharacterized protein n=1 Tax=Myxozyma melibiosi TaxID=54550 RepID=A0ABR1FAS3_9ASCO